MAVPQRERSITADGELAAARLTSSTLQDIFSIAFDTFPAALRPSPLSHSRFSWPVQLSLPTTKTAANVGYLVTSLLFYDYALNRNCYYVLMLDWLTEASVDLPLHHRTEQVCAMLQRKVVDAGIDFLKWHLFINAYENMSCLDN